MSRIVVAEGSRRAASRACARPDTRSWTARARRARSFSRSCAEAEALLVRSARRSTRSSSPRRRGSRSWRAPAWGWTTWMCRPPRPAASSWSTRRRPTSSRPSSTRSRSSSRCCGRFRRPPLRWRRASGRSRSSWARSSPARRSESSGSGRSARASRSAREPSRRRCSATIRFSPRGAPGRWAFRSWISPRLLAESDIVTLHATAGETGRPLLGRAELASMKKGAILVNVARGSLVDREAPARGARVGSSVGRGARRLRSGAARPPDDPLPKLPNVVASPHLGASTVEAQERVALQTVEALLEALSGASYVPAVNLPFRGPGRPDRRRRVDASGGADGAVSRRARGRRDSGPCGVETWGLPEDLLRPVAVAAVKGALAGPRSPESVNYVNALHVAHDRGLSVSETRHEGSGPLRPLDPRDAFGRRRPARAPTRRSSRAATRASSPWTVFRSSSGRRERSSSCAIATCRESSGSVGSILGEGGVNIANFSLARGEGDRAAAVIAVDSAPPPAVLERLRRAPAVEDVRVVTW